MLASLAARPRDRRSRRSWNAGSTPFVSRQQTFRSRPRTFFEEWDSPLISGIQWVEELVEIAGGEPIFPELRGKRLAKDRIVHEDEVRDRRPDVVLASWCGKRMKKSVITSRTGWADVPAVRHDRIYEIPSTYVLQPGPAALTEGLRRIHDRLALTFGQRQC